MRQIVARQRGLDHCGALRQFASLSEGFLLRTVAARMAAPDERRWRARFEALRSFQRRHAHTHVSLRWREDPRLGSWVSTQRQLERQGKLSPERRQELLDLGFEFRRRDAQWDGFFRRLSAFRRKHGHCDVPQRFSKDPRLGEWVSRQRRLFHRGMLSADKRSLLEKQGFTFKARDARWLQRCAQLADFRARNGHCRIPDDGTPLGRWSESLRDQSRAGALSPVRRQELEALGFCFEPGRARRDAFWDSMFARLARLGAQLGHLQVRPTQVADRRLRSWIAAQRHLHTTRRLLPERERRLRELGFSFNTKTDRWTARASELECFIRAHGPWVNPPRSGATLLLARWIDVQRTLAAKGELPERRRQALQALGFVWSLRAQRAQSADERALAALADHRARWGHLWISAKAPETRWLAEWAQRARDGFRTGRLNPTLEARLRRLSLPLDPEDVRWEQLFARLMSYRARHGGNPADHQTELGRWTAIQRQLGWAGELELDREQRLVALGAIDSAWLGVSLAVRAAIG
jgi:hypothetical protein